jgi:hypothetical protein
MLTIQHNSKSGATQISEHALRCLLLAASEPFEPVEVLPSPIGEVVAARRAA